VENVRKRKCVYEREKEVHGSSECVTLLRLVCVCVCELRLLGVSWWALVLFFLPIVFYCVAFPGSWESKKYFLGAWEFFSGGAYTKAMSLRISF
jgi:hypothetical protein